MDLASITIAESATHHARAGLPLYEERFDEVLKYHAPGLAPVRRGGLAWHIDVRGRPAYPRRFARTFGFYEGLAAVRADDGWHHILPDGAPAYAARFAWCGNFQEGRCAVREVDSDAQGGARYGHILPSGALLSEERWRYAGDFRDGFAVVQGADGLSTHIDSSGEPLHGRWYRDLDVYHKAYARARDEDGWTHVDRAGRPAYARRFAMVEAFYNGQARVESEDGSLLVIDERGETLAVLRAPRRDDLSALSADLVGFWRTRALYTAVSLGVIEALPGTADGIAERCGLHPRRTLRLLRALGELHVAHVDDAVWRLTQRGAILRADHPTSLAGAAVEYAERFEAMWTELPAAIRSDGARADSSPDIFRTIAEEGTRVGVHHAMLSSYAAHDYGLVPDALPLRGDERLIDAGGGLGALATLIARRFPAVRVDVLDRPEVVARATLDPVLAGRVRFLARDFFEPWGISSDAVVLSRVLHDWNDDDACRILLRARQAVATGSRIFIIEMILAEEGYAGSLCDLHLLVATGGQERTSANVAGLLSSAGFSYERIIRLDALPSIIVGVAI